MCTLLQRTIITTFSRRTDPDETTKLRLGSGTHIPTLITLRLNARCFWSLTILLAYMHPRCIQPTNNDASYSSRSWTRYKCSCSIAFGFSLESFTSIMSSAKRFQLNVKFELMPESFSAKFRKDFPPYVTL